MLKWVIMKQRKNNINVIYFHICVQLWSHFIVETQWAVLLLFYLKKKHNFIYSQNKIENKSCRVVNVTESLPKTKAKYSRYNKCNKFLPGY